MSDRTDDAGPAEGEVAPRPSAAGLPQPGDVVAERYRIEREIGHGGMAVVYAATQLSGGNRQVALKWLFEGRSHRDERRRRFLREARAAGAVQHPNVVRVYDAGEHRQGVFLVMELVEGQSLTAYLQEQGKLTPRDAIDLLMPAMRGIAALHQKGVIHRDLKPDNLYVSPPQLEGDKPAIKVLDFGLSKLIGPAADSLHTIPGTLVGTPQYMAPEQADHRLGAISERSDVYTLSVILYEAIAGRRPFESETLAGQLMKIAHDEPTPLREVADVPEDLADTIMWGLARNPLQRPARVEDFAIELEQFGSIGFADSGRMSEHKGSLRPRKISDRAPAVQPEAAPPAPAASAPKRTPPLWLIAGAALLLAIVAFALYRAREADGATEASEPQDPAPPRTAPVKEPELAAPSPRAREAAQSAATPPAAVEEAKTAPAPTSATDDAASKPTRATRIAGERSAAPPPVPQAEPATEAPPSAPAEEPAQGTRRKRSPGVADPWAD
jgi:serine/threonine-protein kinase